MVDLLRSTLYQCLAEALAEPPAWLALPGQSWPLFDAAQSLAGESLAARQAVESLMMIGAESLKAREARYALLMAGPGRRGIGMYESGARSGRLLGPISDAVGDWYQQAGLAVNGAEIPDHASLELAFLAFLSGQVMEDLSTVEAIFLREHAARWLPALGREIAATGDPVYAPMGRLLAGWLDETCCRLGVTGFAPHRENLPTRLRGHLPALFDLHACTLCGFCVQVCPTGAMSIHETERSTELSLAADRCISCGKCTRTCPPRVLVLCPSLESGQRIGSGVRLLRTSERATCQACGTPMISQAELAYIGARLDYPEWLAYCPDCRSAGST